MKCVQCEHFTFESKYKLPGFGKCAKQRQLMPELESVEGVYVSPLYDRDCRMYEPAKDMEKRVKWLKENSKEGK